MELQKIFKTDSFDELKSQVKRGINLDRYKNGKFAFGKSQTNSLMGIYHPDGLAEKLVPLKEKDYDNAVLLYESYPELSPLIASTEAFWAYLTHCDYFEYCSKRWPEINNKSIPNVPQNYVYPATRDTTENAKAASEYIGYILTHWFFNAGGRFRNALAGLWWPVYMTVDNEREDQYELTKILFSHADVRATAYASTLFRHKAAIIGILEFYQEHDDIRDEAWQWRNRYIFHYLNRIGGVTNLFYLNKNYFKSELEKNYEVLLNIKSSEDVSNKSELVWY